MRNKSLAEIKLEREISKQIEKQERTQRMLDSVIKERNEFERLYTNLTFDFAELAQLKISQFLRHSRYPQSTVSKSGKVVQ